MALGMEVGLGLGHTVLWGPSSPPQKRAEPPIFGPFLLWLNGWMHQDATWYRGRPQPRRLCVRWGPSPLTKKGRSPPPIFGPRLLWPNGWMDQDATWYGGRHWPRLHCLGWELSSPPKKWGTAPNFRSMSIVAKRLYGSRCYWYVRRHRPRPYCVR